MHCSEDGPLPPLQKAPVMHECNAQPFGSQAHRKIVACVTDPCTAVFLGYCASVCLVEEGPCLKNASLLLF